MTKILRNVGFNDQRSIGFSEYTSWLPIFKTHPSVQKTLCHSRGQQFHQCEKRWKESAEHYNYFLRTGVLNHNSTRCRKLLVICATSYLCSSWTHRNHWLKKLYYVNVNSLEKLMTINLLYLRIIAIFVSTMLDNILLVWENDRSTVHKNVYMYSLFFTRLWRSMILPKLS